MFNGQNLVPSSNTSSKEAEFTNETFSPLARLSLLVFPWQLCGVNF